MERIRISNASKFIDIVVIHKALRRKSDVHTNLHIVHHAIDLSRIDVLLEHKLTVSLSFNWQFNRLGNASTAKSAINSINVISWEHRKRLKAIRWIEWKLSLAMQLNMMQGRANAAEQTIIICICYIVYSQKYWMFIPIQKHIVYKVFPHEHRL